MTTTVHDLVVHAASHKAPVAGCDWCPDVEPRTPPAMLSGPGPVPQYDQPAPSVYPEGGCTCPPEGMGPCLGADCDECWRLPGCERQTPAQMYAAAKAEEDWRGQVGGIATMHQLTITDRTRYRVCLCLDGTHPDRESAGDYADEVDALERVAAVAGECHVLVFTSLTLSRVDYLGGAA